MEHKYEIIGPILLLISSSLFITTISYGSNGKLSYWPILAIALPLSIIIYISRTGHKDKRQNILEDAKKKYSINSIAALKEVFKKTQKIAFLFSISLTILFSAILLSVRETNRTGDFFILSLALFVTAYFTYIGVELTTGVFTDTVLTEDKLKIHKRNTKHEIIIHRIEVIQSEGDKLIITDNTGTQTVFPVEEPNKLKKDLMAKTL